MKVVVVMETSPGDGGGFYQSLNAITQIQRLCAGRHEVTVGTMNPASQEVLVGLGIESFPLPITLFDRLRFLLANGGGKMRMTAAVRAERPAGRKSAWRRWLIDLLRAVPDLVGLERRLAGRSADLVYFVAPWSRTHRLDRLPYWITIWDLAHVEYAEFPELAADAWPRETALNKALLRAGAVIADSTATRSTLTWRYGVEASRVIAMPFMPAPSLDDADRFSMQEVLTSLGLDRGYLFYPAQFWAHKNHVRILEALRLCHDRGQRLRVVFAGGDKGVRGHVESVAARLGLGGDVRFLGFVDSKALRGLYEACSAVVMPTYFGPTNLPPLEAWNIGVPLIYSCHLAEQAGDAALLVDPDDAHALADAMVAVQNPSLRRTLVDNGKKRLQALALEREIAEEEVCDRVRRLEARLRCSGAMT